MVLNVYATICIISICILGFGAFSIGRECFVSSKCSQCSNNIKYCENESSTQKILPIAVMEIVKIMTNNIFSIIGIIDYINIFNVQIMPNVLKAL